MLVVLGLIFTIIYLMWNRVKTRGEGIKIIFQKASADLDAGRNTREILHGMYRKLDMHYRKYGYLVRKHFTFREYGQAIIDFESIIGMTLHLDQSALEELAKLMEIVTYSDLETDDKNGKSARSILGKLLSSLDNIDGKLKEPSPDHMNIESIEKRAISEEKYGTIYAIAGKRRIPDNNECDKTCTGILEYSRRLSKKGTLFDIWSAASEMKALSKALEDDGFDKTGSIFSKILAEHSDITNGVFLDKRATGYLVDCISGLNKIPFVVDTISSKNMEKILEFSMICAVMDKRDFIVPDDVRIAIKSYLPGRIKLKKGSTSKGIEVLDIIHFIFIQTPVPTV